MKKPKIKFTITKEDVGYSANVTPPPCRRPRECLCWVYQMPPRRPFESALQWNIGNQNSWVCTFQIPIQVVLISEIKYKTSRDHISLCSNHVSQRNERIAMNSPSRLGLFSARKRHTSLYEIFHSTFLLDRQATEVYPSLDCHSPTEWVVLIEMHVRPIEASVEFEIGRAHV